jgi:hypothetical protein
MQTNKKQLDFLFTIVFTKRWLPTSTLIPILNIMLSSWDISCNLILNKKIQIGIKCLVSFLINIPIRKFEVCIVILVTKIPLICWNICPAFQNVNYVVINHPVIKTIIPFDNKYTKRFVVSLVIILPTASSLIFFFLR